MVCDTNRDRKHLQQERLALQPRKKFLWAVRTNRGLESQHCNLFGMGRSKNCHSPLSSDIALGQRQWGQSRDPASGLCELHSLIQNHELHNSLPHSSFPGQEGMDEHSHQVMEQHSQHPPESPCPAGRKVKKPGLTTSIACAFSKERKISTEFLLPPSLLAVLVIWRQHLVTKTTTTKPREFALER